MKVLFWGPVTLQLFHFDVKHAKPAKKLLQQKEPSPA
jgi:hypothetical protein